MKFEEKLFLLLNHDLKVWLEETDTINEDLCVRIRS